MLVERPSSAGNGAAPERQCSPALAVRERGGQPQHQATRRGDDLHTDLEQLESQRHDLGPCPGGAARGESQLLKEYVGGGGQLHAQLVGAELGAAGAVEGDVEQLLDAVLNLAALTIDAFVDPLGL